MSSTQNQTAVDQQQQKSGSTQDASTTTTTTTAVAEGQQKKSELQQHSMSPQQPKEEPSGTDDGTAKDEEISASATIKKRSGSEEEENTKTNGSAENKLETAQQLLNTGKRHLACDDYPQAVEALAEACQLFSEQFGEEGLEVAESYFYYGRSLLELARMENGVLGNALDGVAAEEENEADLSESDQFEKASTLPEGEREEIVTQVYTAMSAEQTDKEEKTEEGDKSSDIAGKGEASAEGPTAEASAEGQTAEASAEGQTAEASAEGQSTEAGDSKEDEAEDGDGEETASVESAEGMEEEAAGSQEGEDADDVPNLQLAWEVLELCKRIYVKHASTEEDNKSLQAKLCEVYRCLGEVSLEEGSYDRAILDIESCMQIQSRCLEADNRLLAETHYQLGNAYLFNRDYKQAVEQLRNAKSVIERRIANLESCQDADNKEKRDKELAELKDLLPDVIAKVEDVEDESMNAQKAETVVKAMLASQQGAGSGSTTIGFGDSSSNPASVMPIATKKANDISNLVRKRKPEDQGDEEVKKVKSETDVPVTGDKENGAMQVTTGNK